MKVIFNTYPYAFVCPGGGEIQLLKSLNALKNNNINAELYNQWNPNLADVDIVNFFSVQGGTYNFCQNIKNSNIPLVISPIIWPKGDLSVYPMVEIKNMLDMADKICPNSNIESEIISDVFNINMDKFHTVYNGVDSHFLEDIINHSDESFKNKYTENRPFLLTVGNIEPRKNQLNLIKALNKLNIDIDLILIGHVRDQKYFDQCMTISKNNVKYVGYINHESPLLKSAFQSCDLFVLPSFCETPGLAALEAAAMGAKIVITSEGSTYEYFGNHVSYVNPNSIDSILQGIECEMSTQRDQSLTKRIKKHFSWNNTALQIIECYQNLL